MAKAPARASRKASKIPRPTLESERAHRAAGRVAVGVDEVGRGCLAGPVVTAAVVLPDFILEHADVKPPAKLTPPDLDALTLDSPWWIWITDSKLVPAPVRSHLAQLIRQSCLVQIAWCFPEEIDRYNILHAAMIAMRRAVEPFAGGARAVLVDGHLDPFHPRFRCEPGRASKLGFTHVETLVKGDQRSVSIAAASIVAKVYRDAWMTELDSLFPGYGFAEHKGYSTPAHYDGIRRQGPCAIHRLSFAPFSTRSADCNAEGDGQETQPTLDFPAGA